MDHQDIACSLLSYLGLCSAMSSSFLCFVICLCLCLDNCLCLCHFSYLLTVIFLVFVFSDVLKLLVFWSPPCPRCERREPSRQLFWSSLYNSYRNEAFDQIYTFLILRKTTTRLYVHLVWIVKHSLWGRWASPAKRDGIHFPTPRFGEIYLKISWWNVSQNIRRNFSIFLVMVKCNNVHPVRFGLVFKHILNLTLMRRSPIFFIPELFMD